MLEKFQKMLEDFKENKEKELMTFSIDTVQEYFIMQDINKELRFNAMNKEQLESTDRFEEHFQSIIKKLYVPSYQQENV